MSINEIMTQMSYWKIKTKYFFFLCCISLCAQKNMKCYFISNLKKFKWKSQVLLSFGNKRNGKLAVPFSSFILHSEFHFIHEHGVFLIFQKQIETKKLKKTLINAILVSKFVLGLFFRHLECFLLLLCSNPAFGSRPVEVR